MTFKHFSLISILIFSSIYISLASLSHFEPFNMSMFLDLGYRIAIGQTLYKDVYYHAGPVFPHISALFYKYLGFSTSAVIWHVEIINLLFIFALYVLGKEKLSNISLAIILTFGGVAFYGMYPHPCYDQMAVLLVTFAIIALDCGLQSSQKVRWFFLAGLILGIAFHTKANYGLFSFGIFFLFVFVRRSSLKEIYAYSLGYLVSLIGIVFLLDEPWRYIYQAYFAYSPANRVLDLDKFYTILFSKTFILYSAIGILVGQYWRTFNQKDLNSFLFFIAIFFIAYLSTVTGSTPDWASSFIFCPALVFIFSITHIQIRGKLILFQILTIFFILLTMTYGLSGGSYLYNDDAYDNSWTMNSGKFKGWRCSNDWCPDLDHVYDFMTPRVRNGETILIFPSIQFLYGLLEIPSYAPAPVAFDYGVLLVKGGLYEEFHDALIANPPNYIIRFKKSALPRNDDQLIANWIKIDLLLKQYYREIYSLDRFSIYEQKG